MTKISLIAAMAKDRVIGKDNDMPWYLPADLQHFKKVTLGKPVVMGRRTFESIGRPLPGRKNIVITRNEQWSHDGVDVVSSPAMAMSLVADVEEVMIIGGGKIYEQFLPKADSLYLTFIDLNVDGDTRFPDWTKVGNWQQVEQESHKPDEKNTFAYEFIKLDKK
jgi:dihydrofolate reductase